MQRFARLLPTTPLKLTCLHHRLHPSEAFPLLLPEALDTVPRDNVFDPHFVGRGTVRCGSTLHCIIGDPKRTDPDKRALLLAGNRKGTQIPLTD